MTGLGEGAAPRDGAGGEALRARLVAAGIAVPRAEAVVVDLAGDPPLDEGAAALAASSDGPGCVVACAGAALLASGAKEIVLGARDGALVEALRAAVAAGGSPGIGGIAVARLPEVWPIAGLDRELGRDFAWVLDGEALWRVGAALGLRVPARRYLTVAGAVRSPGAIAVPRGQPLPTVEALVEAAGGAREEPWVALGGTPWPGRPLDREEEVPSSLLLVLPVAHPLVARARVSLADQLRRAASACEGCRACTEVCPPFLDGVALEPHAVVAAEVAGLDGGAAPGGSPAATAACLGCGVCSLACPGGLDPAAILVAARDRRGGQGGLAAARRGPPHPDRAGRRLSVELLRLRAGL